MKINLSGALQCSTNVRVEAHWDPIADSTFNLHEASPIHAELFDFSPSLPTKEYEADDFRVFLPSSAVEIWGRVATRIARDGPISFASFIPGQRQRYITARRELTRVSAQFRMITRR